MKAFALSIAVIALGAAHLSAADPSAAAKKKSQIKDVKAGTTNTSGAANDVEGRKAPGFFKTETQATAQAKPGQTPKPQPKKNIVSGGVLNGKAISKPQPAYPPIAKGSGASGEVKVQVVVDEKGRVTSANAVSGHPKLRDAAVKAAQQARFSPTLLSGQPVKVSGVITYNFVLQ